MGEACSQGSEGRAALSPLRLGGRDIPFMLPEVTFTAPGSPCSPLSQLPPLLCPAVPQVFPGGPIWGAGNRMWKEAENFPSLCSLIK